MESLNIREKLLTLREAIERAKAGGFKWVAITLGGVWFGFRSEPKDFDANFKETEDGYFGWWPSDDGDGSVKLGAAYPERLSKVSIAVEP